MARPGAEANLARVAAGVVVLIALALALTVRTGRHVDDGPRRTAAPSASSPRTAPGRPCPSGGWSLRDRLAQSLMVGVDPTRTAPARRAVEADHVGGIFIGGDATALLTSGTLAELRGPSGVEPLVAVDDEGGRVQRISQLVGQLPSARSLAANDPPAEITRLARTRGEQLASYGVNVDFAPVLDVSDQPDGAVIGDRSFSDDPDRVIEDARAFALGLRRAGITVVYKHFPGHGHATGDSHLGRATTPPLDEMGPDLAPYRSLLGAGGVNGADAVLVGHLVVPGLTEGRPASTSPAAIDGLLRGDLGFDGLVFTDDLGGMRAITDDLAPAEAVRRAWLAGADVALLAQPTDVGALLDVLEGDVAAGRLPATVVARASASVLRAKGFACAA